MAPPVDVYTSFDEPVPSWEFGTGQPGIKESSTGTANAEEPGGWVEIPYTTWNAEANEVLERPEIRKELKRRYIATPDILKLYSESDVVHATALYLNHQVHTALDVYQGGDIYRAAERTNGRESRVDMAYMYIAGGQPDDKAFAVVEYKRCGALKMADFESGRIKTPKESHARFNSWSTSKFTLNAQRAMKQATFYCENYKTRYVALWDMNILVLIFFDNFEEGAGGGSRCLATVVSNRSQMRRALLGFLVMAFKNRANTNDQGPTPPKGFEKPNMQTEPTRKQPSRSAKHPDYAAAAGDISDIMGNLSVQDEDSKGSTSGHPSASTSGGHRSSSKEHQAGGSSSKAGGISSKAGGSSSKAGGSSSKAGGSSSSKAGESSSKAGESSSKAGESSSKAGESSSKAGESSKAAPSSWHKLSSLEREPEKSERGRMIGYIYWFYFNGRKYKTKATDWTKVDDYRGSKAYYMELNGGKDVVYIRHKPEEMLGGK